MKLNMPRSERSRSVGIAVVVATTFALSGVAAWALATSSSTLTQPERISQIAQGEELDVDSATVTVTVSEAAPSVAGATIEFIEYDTSLGRCEDLVITLDGETASVGHCGESSTDLGVSLSDASLSGGGVVLNGRFLQIIQGSLFPNAFPAGTTVQAELLDGRLAIMTIRPDGRFFHVVELAAAPARDEDARLLPSQWWVVAPDGSVLDAYTSVVPTFPITES